MMRSVSILALLNRRCRRRRAPGPGASCRAGGERQVLDLDDLQRGTVGAAADRALLGNAARLGDGRIARQVLEDLIHLVLDEVEGRGEASANALVVRAPGPPARRSVAF